MPAPPNPSQAILTRLARPDSSQATPAAPGRPDLWQAALTPPCPPQGLPTMPGPSDPPEPVPIRPGPPVASQVAPTLPRRLRLSPVPPGGATAPGGRKGLADRTAGPDPWLPATAGACGWQRLLPPFRLIASAARESAGPEAQAAAPARAAGGAAARTGSATVGLSRRAALAALCLPLAACGFAPLYGADSPAERIIGRIAIGQITRGDLPDRMGFTLREQLQRRLGQGGGDPDWRLDVLLGVASQGLAITPDNATTRYNLTGTAAWTLTASGMASPVLTGTAQSYTAYSATATVYATRIAARDAERRMAIELADRIATAIAAQARLLAP